jgi:hypothetical protein
MGALSGLGDRIRSQVQDALSKAGVDGGGGAARTAGGGDLSGLGDRIRAQVQEKIQAAFEKAGIDGSSGFEDAPTPTEDVAPPEPPPAPEPEPIAPPEPPILEPIDALEEPAPVDESEEPPPVDESEEPPVIDPVEPGLVGYDVGAIEPISLDEAEFLTSDVLLQDDLLEIGSLELGARIIRAAIENHLTSIRQAALEAGTNGVNHATADGATNVIEIDEGLEDGPRIRTLIHELGHAATPQNENSISEEMYTDQIAEELTRALGLEPGYELNMESYVEQGLPELNDFVEVMRRYGIPVGG